VVEACGGCRAGPRAGASFGGASGAADAGCDGSGGGAASLCASGEKRVAAIREGGNANRESSGGAERGLPAGGSPGCTTVPAVPGESASGDASGVRRAVNARSDREAATACGSDDLHGSGGCAGAPGALRTGTRSGAGSAGATAGKFTARTEGVAAVAGVVVAGAVEEPCFAGAGVCEHLLTFFWLTVFWAAAGVAGERGVQSCAAAVALRMLVSAEPFGAGERGMSGFAATFGSAVFEIGPKQGWQDCSGRTSLTGGWIAGASLERGVETGSTPAGAGFGCGGRELAGTALLLSIERINACAICWGAAAVEDGLVEDGAPPEVGPESGVVTAGVETGEVKRAVTRFRKTGVAATEGAAIVGAGKSTASAPIELPAAAMELTAEWNAGDCPKA